MTYEERRSIVSVISTLLINVAYAVVILPQLPTSGDYSPEILKFWGSYMLILIPVTVIAKIIIHMVFVMINTMTTGEHHDDEMVDEREQLIKLKSAQIAQYLFALGFMLAMVTLVIEQPPTVMFIILIGTGILTDSASNLAEFYYYRRGI